MTKISGSVGTVLYDIPNQPITFNAESPPRPRSEDDMIAWTWQHYLNDTSNPDWLARLPMTKVYMS